MLEVAHGRALGLLRAEEGDRGLGRDRCWPRRLRGCDDDKPVALGLPGKVDDGVLDGVDDLDRYPLFLDSEDLQGGSLRLLRLGMPIDLDGEVRGVGLPVKFGIRDTEEVQGSDDLLGGYAHQPHLRWVAANLGSPVAEELLILLDTFSLGRRGSPLEVHDTVDFDGRLV